MLKVKEVVKMQIDKEIDCIKKALTEDNIGKARVCARRGAGLAIDFGYKNGEDNNFNLSALNLLNIIKNDTSLPGSVIEAAIKLTEKVNGAEAEKISEDPLTDCLTIVEYFMH